MPDVYRNKANEVPKTVWSNETDNSLFRNGIIRETVEGEPSMNVLQEQKRYPMQRCTDATVLLLTTRTQGNDTVSIFQRKRCAGHRHRYWAH